MANAMGNPVFETAGGDFSQATVTDSSGKEKTLSNWVSSFLPTREVVPVSASGEVTLSSVSTGAVFVVTATADTSLKLPVFDNENVAELTLVIVGSNFNVTLPTDGIAYKNGDIPAVDTTPGRVTFVRYVSIPGVSSVLGGI